MFDRLTPAVPDAILGLNEAFLADPNPRKINLSVGVYKDEDGRTPIFRAVKAAERRLLEQETTKGYLPISGSPDYADRVAELLFGAEHPIVASGRSATAHCPGGTGALRVAGEFHRRILDGNHAWLSQPTWPNHPQIFSAAGLEVRTYPYFDAASNRLDFAALLRGLQAIPRGELVVLHGCCHNPTGIDPTLEQWKEIADVVQERGLVPLVDFAYQGLADGLEEDAGGLRELCRPGVEILIASSFSKNFGLYRERVGALTILGASQTHVQTAMGHVKSCIRANYSNPPAHGGAIVTTVLGDPELSDDWRRELAAMRDRILDMRLRFVDTLRQKGVRRDFSFIPKQRGMFSFSGLTSAQVDALREQYAIYIVQSGRINVAGMTPANMDRLCQSIAEILGDSQ